MGGNVIIRVSHRYLENKAPGSNVPICLATRRLNKEIKMRKTILTILGSALLAASTVQVATAAENPKAQKIYRAPTPATEGFRNSNSYWPAPSVDPRWSRYENGAESAPAGR
jgi:hypothetical protein